MPFLKPESSPLENSSHLGSISGFLLTINVVIGAGVLGLPYAFKQSGYLLSSIYTVLCCILGYYWACQLIEVMSRCEAITQLKAKGIVVKRPNLKQIIFGKTKLDIQEHLISNYQIEPDITHRRIDLTEMVSIIFGDNWKNLYLLILLTISILSLVSYSVIFSTSLASELNLGFINACDIYETTSFFSECRKTYWFYLAILLGIGVYLSLIDVHEQKTLQNLLTFFTLFNVILVILACIVSLAFNLQVDCDQPIDSTDFKMVDFLNIGTSVPIILFASLYHISLPSIIENVQDKTTNITRIIKSVLVASLFIYMSMGLLVPFTLKNVEGQYNIGFRNYSAGYSQDERPFWTYIIAYFIVLLPGIGILTSFALTSIALSHNLISYFYGVNKSAIPRLGEY